MPLQKTFGVDLGTSMVKIYSCREDTILSEKNMIAIRNKNQTLAAGNDAYEIYEKNPANVEVIKPVLYGKIADIDHTEMVLHMLLEKAGASSVFGNVLYLAVPADLSEIEKRAYYTIGNSSRKNKVYMVDKTIADAVALGIPINKTKGSMVVNIGAQSTELSVIESGRVIISKTLETGGNRLNESIINQVRRRCNLNIGTRTARRLKISLAYLEHDPREARKASGIDILSGLPQEAVVTSRIIYDAIIEPLNGICDEIHSFLERIPPQIRQNIAKEGIYVTGGTTRIPDIEIYISRRTGQKVCLSRFYDLSTIYGLKEIINSKALKKWVK